MAECEPEFERGDGRTGEPPGDWVSDWIAQQRELLHKRTEPMGADSAALKDDMRALGDRWLDLSQAYLTGLAHFAQSPFAYAVGQGELPAGAFNVGDEVFSAWRSAWANANMSQQAMTNQFADVLGRLPPIGLAREHTDAWRELAAAQAECQHLEQELRAVLMQVQTESLQLLQQRVAERARMQQPVQRYRELYDLWVECGEQVYARVAHSDAYCKLQAEVGNASLRLRARQQKIIERGLKLFDLPTRSELNTVHGQLRELRQKLAALEARPVVDTVPASQPAARREPASAAVGVKAGSVRDKSATARRPPRTAKQPPTTKQRRSQ